MTGVAAGLAAAAMGLVEGLTEFLPVSSTGHLILAEEWMGAEFHESFEVVIQSGAVLAVLVEYWRRFLRLGDLGAREGFAGMNGLFWLGLTSLPAGICGFLFHAAIKENLFGPGASAVALAAGGAAMIVLERALPARAEVGVDEIGWKRALGIGHLG